MPLGNKCPSCGKQTYHKDGLILRCSGCGAVGWISAPGAPAVEAARSANGAKAVPFEALPA